MARTIAACVGSVLALYYKSQTLAESLHQVFHAIDACPPVLDDGGQAAGLPPTTAIDARVALLAVLQRVRRLNRRRETTGCR